jgi:hypothetical protein
MAKDDRSAWSGFRATRAGPRTASLGGPATLRRAGLVEALGQHVDVNASGTSLYLPSRERDSRTHLIDPGGFARLVPV